MGAQPLVEPSRPFFGIGWRVRKRCLIIIEDDDAHAMSAQVLTLQQLFPFSFDHLLVHQVPRSNCSRNRDSATGISDCPASFANRSSRGSGRMKGDSNIAYV